MIRRILFQGDSITDVNRTKDAVPNFMMGGGYATMTAGRLSADHPELGLEFINRGISGNRVSDLYARWKVDAINLRPDFITILIGINDVWHEVDQSNGVDTERFEEVYRMLLKWTLRDLPEVKLVLLEPFYLVHGVVAQESWAPYISDIDAKRAVVRRIADEFGTAFIPLHDEITQLASRFADPAHVLVDGVHPASAGAQLIADRLVAKIEEML